MAMVNGAGTETQPRISQAGLGSSLHPNKNTNQDTKNNGVIEELKEKREEPGLEVNLHTSP